MPTNNSPAAPYAERLARESVKFGCRIAGVFGGIVARALWQAAKQLPAMIVERHAGAFTAKPIRSYREAQNAFDAGRIGAVEILYYRSVYDAQDA